MEKIPGESPMDYAKRVSSLHSVSPLKMGRNLHDRNYLTTDGGWLLGRAGAIGKFRR